MWLRFVLKAESRRCLAPCWGQSRSLWGVLAPATPLPHSTLTMPEVSNLLVCLGDSEAGGGTRGTRTFGLEASTSNNKNRNINMGIVINYCAIVNLALLTARRFALWQND
ncbi:hypothetical protein ALC53_02839 [Atta colombica]|uniref:Uncharacterized protein n=1 Tax=Atta colombica TaxID=520822 RepID=A0A195BPB5_9HYME|nr:hypothetical protein ALC53_02839 [Atta colombica]